MEKKFYCKTIATDSGKFLVEGWYYTDFPTVGESIIVKIK